MAREESWLLSGVVRTAEVREPVSEGDDGVLSRNPWQVKDGGPLVLSQRNHLMLVTATPKLISENSSQLEIVDF